MVAKCEDYRFSSYNDYKMNKGVANCEIIKKIFGEGCSLNELFAKKSGRIFMDIDKPTISEINEHIMNGTREFQEISNKKISDIFCERDTFKHLIQYLKEGCGISYVWIMKFFDISQGAIDSLKK